MSPNFVIICNKQQKKYFFKMLQKFLNTYFHFLCLTHCRSVNNSLPSTGLRTAP